MSVEIVHGDCREIMSKRGPFDMVLADPPYGDTSLEWDRKVAGWLEVARDRCNPTGSMWVFGSFKFFLGSGDVFAAAGWRLAQEIVWEKHNGSGFHADRFKRVHEIAAHFYRDDAPWAGVWNQVQTTRDAAKRSMRRKNQPKHTGTIAPSEYRTEAGGPRIMRSVIYCRSAHGRAIHPTEKPVELLEILIRTSCPPGGLVGDFFAGSGAGGDAARMCGREYLGVEIDPTYFEAAKGRLRGQLPLAVAG